MLFSAHPTAIVEHGASIGPGTKIWHHAHVMGGARVGAGCTLGKDVFVADGAVVGDRVKLQNGVSVFQGVTLEDDVFVGPHAVFTNVESPRASFDRRAEIAPTRVEKGATIGAGAVIVCGVTVGACALVGAGAVVTRSVAPHALVVGNPARRMAWVSRAGRRLPPGPGVVSCPETGERYRVDEVSCELVHQSAARIPLQDVAAEIRFFEPQLKRAFERVLHSATFILGPEVAELERRAADYLRCEDTVAVSSGSDALLVTLMALGVGPGDEVITTPISFFATVGAILRLGASPIFADIDGSTQNLAPAAVEACITARTRAILPVHLFGLPADDALFDLGMARGIPIVEDAAQCFGARTVRGAAGTNGIAGCFSFFPTKNLGALGDAGMVATRNKDLAERIRAMRVHGAKTRYHHELLGGNFRLDALQAAFLNEKLPALDSFIARRRANASRYRQSLLPLQTLGALHLPPAEESHVYHHYVIRCARRDALAKHLSEQGVESAVYYPRPLHRMPLFPTLHPSLPVAEAACDENLALPVHPWLTDDDVERVSQAVLSFFSQERS